MQLLMINWENPGVFKIFEVEDEQEIDTDELEFVREVGDILRAESGEFFQLVTKKELLEGEEEQTTLFSHWKRIS